MAGSKEFNLQSAREITTAIQAHLAWKTRIQSTIDGTNTEQFSTNLAADNTKCVLGEWLSNAGTKSFANDPLFQTLNEQHAIFHQYAGKALQLAQEGKKTEARQSILSGGFADASRNVINALTDLYQQAKKE